MQGDCKCRFCDKLDIIHHLLFAHRLNMRGMLLLEKDPNLAELHLGVHSKPPNCIHIDWLYLYHTCALIDRGMRWRIHCNFHGIRASVDPLLQSLNPPSSPTLASFSHNVGQWYGKARNWAQQAPISPWSTPREELDRRADTMGKVDDTPHLHLPLTLPPPMLPPSKPMSPLPLISRIQTTVSRESSSMTPSAAMASPTTWSATLMRPHPLLLSTSDYERWDYTMLRLFEYKRWKNCMSCYFSACCCLWEKSLKNTCR
jgi:hypothetical protein